MLNSPRIPGGFASKMIAAFLLVILVPTVIISISFYLVSIGIVKQNARDSARQISARTADSLSYILNIGSDTADLLYSNASIQAAARSTGVPVAERQKMDELVNSTLNNLVYSSSFVRIIYVLRETENSWGSGSFSQAKLNQHPPSTLDWVREAKEKDGQLVWQALQYDQFSGAGDNTDLVLPVGRVLKDFDTLENIGYILVCLNGHDVLEQIRSARLGKTGRFFVTDAEGRVMVADDLSRIGQKAANPELLRHAVDPAVREFEFDESGVRHYAIKQPLSNGWMLIGVVPVDEITGALDELQRRILYSSGLVTFLAVAIGLVTAGMVTRPIKQLIRQMKSVQEGNLQARTDIRSRDEIGLMSHHFNKMLQRIDQLMQQVREEQEKKKEAELRAVATASIRISCSTRSARCAGSSCTASTGKPPTGWPRSSGFWKPTWGKRAHTSNFGKNWTSSGGICPFWNCAMISNSSWTPTWKREPGRSRFRACCSSRWWKTPSSTDSSRRAGAVASP